MRRKLLRSVFKDYGNHKTQIFKDITRDQLETLIMEFKRIFAGTFTTSKIYHKTKMFRKVIKDY